MLDDSLFSIGWGVVNRDLRTIAGDRDGLKEVLAAAHPAAKPRGIANWAGTLPRFRDEMRVGDIVVAPYKPDSTINIGVITGEYTFHPEAPTHRHRRTDRWHKVGISRSVFTQPALYEIGAFMTVFAVRKHTDEFLAVLDLPDDSVEEVTRRVEQVAVASEDDPWAATAPMPPTPSATTAACGSSAGGRSSTSSSSTTTISIRSGVLVPLRRVLAVELIES